MCAFYEAYYIHTGLMTSLYNPGWADDIHIMMTHAD